MVEVPSQREIVFVAIIVVHQITAKLSRFIRKGEGRLGDDPDF